jgi:signal transduction histidine kinase
VTEYGPQTRGAGAEITGAYAGSQLSREGTRGSGLTSPIRTAVVTILAIALSEIVTMAILENMKDQPYWLITLLDAAIMVAVSFPVLWFLVFQPLSRLNERGNRVEERLLRRTGELEALDLKHSALFHAEQRARQQADTLRSASLAITRSLDLEAVFTALLGHLNRIVLYDRAKVMLLETESRLRVRAVFNPAGQLDFADKAFDSFNTEANTAVREVLETRRTVCIDDTLARPGWGGGSQPGFERSWLGVPLLSGAEVIGLYTLVKAEPGYFTPERVHLVEALWAPASVAIANGRLFEELRSGRSRLQALSRKLVEAQEAERRRVARELHDEAGQLLASLAVGLRLLEHAHESPEAVLAQAAKLRLIAHSVQESLHRLATDLRPAALDHLGLVPALGQLAGKLSGAGGPVIQLETIGFEGKRLPPDLDIALYRIAQEALTNAVRHSGAGRVSLVAECRDKGVIMVIEDDGHGFDVDAAMQSGRLGLAGIRERVEMVGGTVLVESSPSSGTTLVVEVPNVA